MAHAPPHFQSPKYSLQPIDSLHFFLLLLFPLPLTTEKHIINQWFVTFFFQIKRRTIYVRKHSFSQDFCTNHWRHIIQIRDLFCHFFSFLFFLSFPPPLFFFWNTYKKISSKITFFFFPNKNHKNENFSSQTQKMMRTNERENGSKPPS